MSPQAKENLGDTKVKIFLGTWCGDSKTWVPQVYQYLLDQGMPAQNVEFIGLHNSDEYYKQGPENEEVDHKIHRVPSFLFYKDDKEFARIVESPLTAVDIDVAQIMSGHPSSPRYRAANYCMDFLQENALGKFDKEILTIFKYCRREVTRSSELNTLVYVLKAKKKYKEALKVASLNRMIFPHDPNTHDTEAEMHACVAGACYEKVLKISPENEHAATQLSLLQALIHQE